MKKILLIISDVLLFLSVIILNTPAFAAETPYPFGELRFAVVLLDYANDGTAPSIDEIRQGFFDSEYSVNNFIKEASYGKTTISGDIFGWIFPPNPLYGTGWTSCWPVDQDRFNLLLDNYPNVDLTEYDGFVFYVNGGCGVGVANTFGIEQRETYTSFGKINTRIFYLATKFYFPYQAYSRITDSTLPVILYW